MSAAESRSLEERLRELEDRNAILDVLSAYGHSLDYGDEDAWLRCWAEDAVLHWPRLGRIEGHEALLAAFRDHTHAPDKYHKHLVVDPKLDLDGDTARVESYFARLDLGADEPYIYSFGRYCDVLVRSSDGQWRFKERQLEVEGRHRRAT